MLPFEGGILLLKETVTVEKTGCDPQNTSFISMYDACSYVGNYSCTKEKGIDFWPTLVFITPKPG